MGDKVVKNIACSRPVRMWIDGKCFNLKQLTTSKSQKKGISNEAGITLVQTETEDLNRFNDEIEFSNEENGKLSTSFILPSIYYIKLHQKQNIDLETLSKETETNISIPKHGSEGKIIIRGDTKEDILSALEMIHSTVGQIRQQSSALQFIGIPLLSDEIKSNFEKFKEEILSQKDQIQGMEESIFQKANKLHLTIDIFVLQDKSEKQVAVDALNEYKDTILMPLLEKTGPLTIQVSGIDCMNDNYKKVNVLYAKAKLLEGSGELSLQNIMNTLSDFFYERGLLKSHQDNVKVHMTLLNTKYRNAAGSPKRWVTRIPFDATKIIERYKDFNFGTSKFDNIRISLISTVGEDGFYKSLYEIKF